MRRVLLPTVVIWLAVYSSAVGCLGSEGDPQQTPTCTPPPAVALTVDVHGLGFESYAARPALFRVVASPSVVLHCSTGLVSVTGEIDFVAEAFGPVGAAVAELVVSSDGDPAVSASDLVYSFTLGSDGLISGDACSSTREWRLDFDRATTAVATNSTWTVGASCPGN